MTTSIHLLDEETINQIAAGEVVENSASVVKEIVENALDAGATHITIEIIAGGKQLIRISDNGKGMHKEDAKLSLVRHATSKITCSSDLAKIMTRGFRGEALAAIGSISKLRLTTNSSPDEGSGFMIVQEGGKIVETTEALHKKGTTVEISSLFYNTPARRKFQRSLNADTAAIVKVVQGQALANPHVHFELFQGNEKLLFCPASTLEMRMKTLLGDQEFLPLLAQEGPYQIEGFISDPRLSRSNRTGQYLFINDRPVTSPVIAHAILEGYGTLLESRRFPLFVLHLTMDPALVDVNVHPQKEEVRLREESFLREWLAKTVSLALHKPPEKQKEALPWEKPAALSEEMSFKRTFSFSPPPSFTPVKQTSQQLSFDKQPFPLIGSWKKYLFIDPLHVPSHHNLSFKEDSLLVLYRERARETLLFANMKNKTTPSLHYLTEPVTVELSAAEKQALHTLHLEEWGFVIRSFGPKTVLVEALPVSLDPLDVKDTLLACLENTKKPLEKIAHSLRGDKLSPTLWLDAFFALEHIQWSPSGEPNFFLCGLDTYKKA